DADMRRPFAHHYLGLPNGKGLSDFLTGQATIEEIVREVPGSTLKVVTAGGMSPNPSELVASDLFRQILEYGSDNFDRVVIDVPPVLFIPDGLIVAKHVHSGVLICGSGMVHKKTVKTVKEKFDSIGHSFIGIILNKVNYEKGMGRYKYYRTYKNYYSKIRTAAAK
ncbi:MAG TPA: CpsD/CapB family tyrosine-protein kinase, partial [Candidatus Eisenbacteria bacterium]|nr:CpsD/CapB family tyrosine-protein kinase [Candidatus Eisenbacteria bacterium]